MAALAATSVPTVSKVLNGRPGVSESTRRRVLTALAELGAPARPRRPRRSHLLSLRVDNLDGPWFQELVRGVVHAASEEDLEVVVSTGTPHEFDTWVAHSLQRGALALLCAVGLPSTRAIDLASGAGVPVIAIDPWRPTPELATVTCDHRAGAQVATEHLLALGHRRIAFLGGPPALANAQLRLEGFLRSMHEAGVAVEPDLLRAGRYTVACGYRAGQYFLALPEAPTAVFAASDDSAVGLLRALREAQVAVPGGMSVVGFDNLPTARWSEPALTTVHQPIEELGVRAVADALDLAQRAPASQEQLPRVVLPTRLITRETTAPPT
ncbi:LacI family DNA-binding transcriptional regulator [Serinibacter salmoneus]|uniref:LacI family DNA-binding transcriptional regulator n=1 Tax=Serinibacter salmoneus TaxID=556530 RepID=UPI0014734492|nr:LacI family DNA-binding transcriptional regulator [Serinibacter salmoneus]